MRRQLNDHDAGGREDAKEFPEIADGQLGLQVLQDDTADDEIEGVVMQHAKVRRVVADVRDGFRKAIQFCCEVAHPRRDRRHPRARKLAPRLRRRLPHSESSAAPRFGRFLRGELSHIAATVGALPKNRVYPFAVRFAGTRWPTADRRAWRIPNCRLFESVVITVSETRTRHDAHVRGFNLLSSGTDRSNKKFMLVLIALYD